MCGKKISGQNKNKYEILLAEFFVFFVLNEKYSIRVEPRKLTIRNYR